MKHFLIFRFCGQDIKNLLNENERTLLGGYGEIYEGRILVPDERIEVLKFFFKEQTNKNNFIRTENFISSAWYEFHYTKSELDSVKILRIIPTRTIMICGEECGTEYDYSGCCPECNSGRKLISHLNIHKSRLPKSADWIRTYAGETIVTEKLVNCFVDYNLAGMNYIQMNTIGYFYPIIKEKLEISSDTEINVHPLYPELRDGYISPDGTSLRCKKCGAFCGDVLAEASVVNSNSIEKNDLFISRQVFGVSRGYLYYEPLYFCSQKFRRMVETEKLKGFKFEVAHIVEQ